MWNLKYSIFNLGGNFNNCLVLLQFNFFLNENFEIYLILYRRYDSSNENFFN